MSINFEFCFKLQVWFAIRSHWIMKRITITSCKLLLLIAEWNAPNRCSSASKSIEFVVWDGPVNFDLFFFSLFGFYFQKSDFHYYYWLLFFCFDFRYQRTRRICSRLRSTGSFPRGTDQLVRFPLPARIHSGTSHFGFLPPGQELRPRYLHHPGKIDTQKTKQQQQQHGNDKMREMCWI